MCYRWACGLLILSAAKVIFTQDRSTMENVATGKWCNISTMYYGDGISNNCSNAINGNTGTDYTAGNCINTADEDVSPSWTVDLGQYFTIQRITVYGRASYKARLRNLQVFVDSRVVFTFPGLYGQPETITEITPLSISSQGNTNLPIRGRYVRLARFRSNMDYDALILNICEVQVWACKIGHYGLNCDQCNFACANSSCDDITYPDTCPAYNPCDNNPCQNNGACQRLNDINPHNYICLCPPGYTGTNCTQDIDECTNSPCVSGTCQNTYGSYNCTCFSGYTGQKCSIEETNASQTRDISRQTGSIVGAIMGAGALIGLCVVVAICWKRRTHGDTDRRNTTVRYADPNAVPAITRTSTKTSGSSRQLDVPDPDVPDPDVDQQNDAYVDVCENTYDALHASSSDASPEIYTYAALNS